MRPRFVTATRYVTPLREGGSLPAIVEADDDGLYVAKFRGAGQGPKVLIAELVAGELGRTLRLPIPEIVFLDVDPVLSKAEPDPEIQDLLKSSGGLNIGIDYLPGSLAFVAGSDLEIDPVFAAEVIWFDALIMNVDRTPRNPNMLIWHGAPWLIDHGASIYIHHGTPGFSARAGEPFRSIADHVLLPFASSIELVADDMALRCSPDNLEEIVSLIPDSWLDVSDSPGAASARLEYLEFFRLRLEAQRGFVEEAERARARSV